MTKFIFFLLNLQGISFKIKIFVTNSRKIISLQKKYILKYLYILSYYIITGSFCLVLRHHNEECGNKELKPNRICSYTKS